MAGNKVQLEDLWLSCNSPTAGNTYYPKPIYSDYGTGVNDIPGRANTLTELIVDVIANGLNNLPGPEQPTIPNNTCERDLGLIIDGMLIDIENGTNATSMPTICQRYSHIRAKARITQKTETLAALTKAKYYVRQVVSNPRFKRQSNCPVLKVQSTTNTFQHWNPYCGTHHVRGGVVTSRNSIFNISNFAI